MMIVSRISGSINYAINKAKWKRRNRHNHTHLVTVDGDTIDIVTIGNGTYGGIKVLAHSCDSKLRIGSYCSIAPEVVFIPGSEHSISQLSTFPFKVHYLNVPHEASSKGDIIIDDDVWLGYGSMILSGVHVAQGAVVAAGAVVNKNVEPYAIVGGVPAKVIRYRFEKPVIDYLLTLDYSKLDTILLQQHIDAMYKPIDGMKLEEIKKLYDWFPKKYENSDK